MLSWLSTYEGRRITKMRLQLWWHFRCFWFECPYRVVLRYHRRSLPWSPYWAWVTLIPGKPPCEIGSIEQWSMGEALEHARVMYRKSLLDAESAVANGSRARPFIGTAPVMNAPPHLMQVDLQPGSCYRIKCTCGWLSGSTQSGHMCLPANCTDCRIVQAEWEAHVKEMEVPKDAA